MLAKFFPKIQNLPEKKDCDEPENNNGDERVAPKKALDEIVARQRRAGSGTAIGDGAATSATFNHAASARLPANSEMLRLRYKCPVSLL